MGTRNTAHGYTATEGDSPNKASNRLVLLGRLAGAAFGVGLGYVCVLNMQPWLWLAELMARHITIVPFLDALTAIPYLGGWIMWVAVNIARILGVCLWLGVQLVQIAPMLIRIGGLEKKWQHRLEHLDRFRAIVYPIEFLVCFLRFPPYTGGVEGLQSDWPDFDLELIDWGNLGLMLVTAFGIEILVGFIAAIISQARSSK